MPFNPTQKSPPTRADKNKTIRGMKTGKNLQRKLTYYVKSITIYAPRLKNSNHKQSSLTILDRAE